MFVLDRLGQKETRLAGQHSRICGDSSLHAPGLPVMGGGCLERWPTGPSLMG